jgi:HK97 family phage major capsid protein
MPSAMTLTEFSARSGPAPPRVDSDVMCSGGPIKALPGRPGRVGGLAIKFNHLDCQGDIFDAQLDAGLDDMKTCRVVYHHGMGRFGNARIGTGQLEKRPDGIYCTIDLDLTTPGGRAAWEEAQAGKAGLSSGSTDRLVVKSTRVDGKRVIRAWPICEISITPTPVAGLEVTRVVPIKAMIRDPFLERQRQRIEARHPKRPGLAEVKQLRARIKGETCDPVSVSTSMKGSPMTMRNTFDGAVKAEDFDGDFGGLAEFLNVVRTSKGDMTGRLAEYSGDLKALGLAGDISSDGGVLIPPRLAAEVWRQAVEMRFLPLAYARQNGVESNEAIYPAWDDDSQTNGSRYGGLRSYRIGNEGDELTKSTPTLRFVRHRLSKHAVSVGVTDELLEDRPDVGDIVGAAVAEEFAWVLSDQMIRGDGANAMTGTLGSAATITAAAAGTGSGVIVEADVRAMFGRLPASSKGRAVWFYHSTAETQLFDAADAAGVLRLAEPGQTDSGIYATICGRPAVQCELCEAVGTLGDVILADFGQYGVTTRSPGIRDVISMHVRFDKSDSMMRFTLRYDGRPMWVRPRTPYKGSTTQSPFVLLGASRG